MKFNYKKYFLFILPFLFIFFSLFLVPYYNIFSFEQKNEENLLKTSFDLEELKKINEIFQSIDEEKIFDKNFKNKLVSLKQSFLAEQNNLFKEIEAEELKILEQIQNDRKEEKEIIYPKKFDVTDKLAKLHIQERNLSCEASATTDILSTVLKKDILEIDILEKMKKDKTYWKPSYKNSEWKLIWWDPNEWFVWIMDWYQYNLTGYAIYEKPMSEIYTDYWVKTETYNKFENNLWLNSTKEALVYMLKELVKWNYVQMWWDYCTDQNFEDWNIDRKISTEEANSGFSQKNFCYSFHQERTITWYTDDWKEIRAGKQSHNFVLLWYIWDIENPEKIIIWDTQTWKHIYPTAERMRKWELNDARAIIVYNNEEKVEEKEEKMISEEKQEEETKKEIVREEIKRREENIEIETKKD